MAATTDSERERQLIADGEGLRRLARGLLGPGADGADADDLLQSTFAAALASPRRDATEQPWLRATLRNLARLWRRTAARRQARERIAAVPEQQTACDPAAIALRSELLRDVAAAVHELAEPYRSVVVLRFWQGLLPEAIAVQLGVPRNTVRSRLQRGLAMLRAEFDSRYGTRERWAAPLGALVGVRAAMPAAVTGGGEQTLLDEGEALRPLARDLLGGADAQDVEQSTYPRRSKRKTLGLEGPDDDLHEQGAHAGPLPDQLRCRSQAPPFLSAAESALPVRQKTRCAAHRPHSNRTPSRHE